MILIDLRFILIYYITMVDQTFIKSSNMNNLVLDFSQLYLIKIGLSFRHFFFFGGGGGYTIWILKDKHKKPGDTYGSSIDLDHNFLTHYLKKGFEEGVSSILKIIFQSNISQKIICGKSISICVY